MRRPLTILLAALAAGALGAAEAPTDRFQKVVDRLVEAINAADYEAVSSDFGEVMLKAFPRVKSEPFFRDVTRQFGKIQRLEAPRFAPPNQAVFPARFERGVLDIKIVLDAQDKIVGLWFLPHTPAIPVPDRHETELSLPFKGKWLVFWGGDTKEQNQHHDVPNQRYAFDFVGVGPEGETHKNDGERNEDYYAFGREVLAPADGVVTDVVRGVRDNVPGLMNPYSAIGNDVLIRHQEREVSVLCHLKQDSIRVQVGQKVKAGQVVGLCGNSGNSSEPHLHYHLQNTPVIQDGTGIKVFFQKVLVKQESEMTTRSAYSPVKDEVIEPPEKDASAVPSR